MWAGSPYAHVHVMGSPYRPKTALDQHIEHLALGVDGSPKVDHAADKMTGDVESHPRCKVHRRTRGCQTASSNRCCLISRHQDFGDSSTKLWVKRHGAQGIRAETFLGVFGCHPTAVFLCLWSVG